MQIETTVPVLVSHSLDMALTFGICEAKGDFGRVEVMHSGGELRFWFEFADGEKVRTKIKLDDLLSAMIDKRDALVAERERIDQVERDVQAEYGRLSTSLLNEVLGSESGPGITAEVV